ncbi:ATP-dependent Clp protease proteolytic subunit, partial [Micromonospora aurantiaca]|nr:ATP-dependent Clp protease proteolytic subunit [Micromonospora aurantiaca]
HQPATEGTYGQSSDIEIQAREIMRIRELLESILAEHSGRSIDEVRRDIERDKILTADEAKDYGLIDDVFASRKRKAEVVSS